MVSRAVICCFAKVPMLWAKISLLALTYDELSKEGKGLFESLFAIFLAWYSILPMLLNFPRIIAFCIVCILLFPATHLFGIFLCDSHDWSMLVFLRNNNSTHGPRG